MRGISFLVNSEYNNYIGKILQCTDLAQYTWCIDEDEVLVFDENKGRVCEQFFSNLILTGREFEEIVTQKEYYVVQVNMKAYPPNAPRSDIQTYSDFVKSKCEVVLLISDAIYVELYCKNREYIENVRELCRQNDFKNVEYITDENDCRTRFSVL